MPDLSTRVVTFYTAFAFPIALLCAIPFFERPSVFDDAAERRYLRRARLLLLAAPLHVLFPLTAYAMVRDAASAATEVERNHDRRRQTAALAIGGIVVSLALTVLLAATSG